MLAEQQLFAILWSYRRQVRIRHALPVACTAAMQGSGLHEAISFFCELRLSPALMQCWNKDVLLSCQLHNEPLLDWGLATMYQQC